jgi:hypothetical protein
MMACYAFYSVHLTGRIITSFASYFTDLFDHQSQSACFTECIA